MHPRLVDPSGLSVVRHRRYAVGAISVAAAMATLDTSMTNTALPSMARDMGLAPNEVIDVVTIYQFCMVALMLPLAALGSRIAHRNVFIGGLVIFVGACVWCAGARSIVELEAARALQGLGAAAIMGTNLALVRLIYPADKLGKGLGLNALVIALSLAAGPVLASALLSGLPWQGLFLIHVPLGLLAAWWAWRVVPQGPLSSTPFDTVAALLCTITLGALVACLDALAHGARSLGWLVPVLLVSGYGLWRHERPRASPIFPLDLLHQRGFALGVVCMVCAFATQGAALVTLPFLLQESMGKPIAEVGALIAPWPIVGAMMGPVVGAWSDRIAPSALGSAGLACLAVGVLALGLLPASAPVPWIVVSVGLCGLGFGLFLSPSQKQLMAQVPAERSGAAGGFIGLARLLGQTIGALIVAWCLGLQHLHSEQLAMFIGAGMAALGCLVGVYLLVWLRPSKRA